MKKLLTAGVLMIVSWTACSQSSDSTALYPVPKYKLYRLLDVYIYDYPSCQKVNKSLTEALDSTRLTLDQAGKVIEIMGLEIASKDKESTLLYMYMEDQAKVYKQELRHSRQKGRKEGFFVGGGIGLIISILALL